MSRFSNCRKRLSSRRTALIALSVGCVSLLGLVVGCGGDSGRAPNGGLSVKGLYIGMPGDSALKAYKKLIDGSKDLMVVDYRNGVGPELDEETKAKQKKDWENTVKLAEADIDLFQKWNSLNGEVYDPSVENCEGRIPDPHSGELFHDEPFRPRLKWMSGDKSAKVPGPQWTLASAMAAFAGIYGYQVEWMLPGKHKGENAEKPVPKLYSGRMSVPEKMKDSSLYSVWNSEVLTKGLLAELYSKGLQLSKENEKRVFFRLAFEDAQGNPIDKKKLATELVLNNPMFFEEFGSNEEKIESAEKELEGFLLWVEFLREQNFGGSSIRGVSLLDPEDPRPENVKENERREAEVMAEMAKRGDTRGLEKMNMMRKAQGLPPLAVTADSKSPVDSTPKKAASTQSSGVSAEIKSLKAELAKAEGRKSSLDAEIEKIKHQLNLLASDERQMKGQSPAIMNNPVHRKRRAEIKKKKQETLELYGLAIEKQKETIAVITDIKKQIKNKETIQRQEIAAREKAAADAEAAEKKAAAEAKAAEEAELAKKNRTDLRFLTAARTGSYNRTTSNYAYQFSETMKKMAVNCNVMLEWAVLTEPADKLEEITEVFSIPAGDYESAVKFVNKMNVNLGKFSESTVGSDGSRKRIYFEKDLVDIYSPLWFRLVLKTTNGVEVAKADAVKNWLEARGQFPPNGRMKISKKPAIEVALNKGATKEKEFMTLCYVWLDKDGNVKKIQFNESGLDRFFNAKDMSGEDLAKALVENYSELPSLQPDVKRMEFSDNGLFLIQQETTWTHKSPQGYRLDLFERAYHSNTGLTQKQLLSDPQVSIALSLAEKLPTKRLTVVVTQPESAGKFD